MTDAADAHTRTLASGDDDPTAWFEQLYTEAADGRATVPWDLPRPGAGVDELTRDRELTGVRTLVVGCGLGRDAEYLASLGADVVAFDIAPTAIAGALARHPGTPVEYVVADLLSPPAEWAQAFALVVENMNVQALPEPLRSRAIAAVGRFVGPDGVLLVSEAARTDDAPAEPGPPWPLLRVELESFAQGGLVPVALDGVAEPGQTFAARWRGEFRRPATGRSSGGPADTGQVSAVPDRLFHVVERDAWEQAVRDGAYVWSTRGVTVADEGFVHLSRADQVAGTLGLFYADVPGDLLLLVVDPELTTAPMRLEGGFFHTYGALPVAAVVDALPIARDDAGSWVSPVS